MSDRQVAGHRPRPSTPPASRVTQAMLSEFLALAGHARRLKELRVRLVGLLEAGAPVEPGPLTVSVRRLLSRRLTAKSLAAVIGEDLVKDFLQHVEPTESRRLDVRVVGVRPGTVPGGRPGRGRRTGPIDAMLPP